MLIPTREETIDRFGGLYARHLLYKAEVEGPMETLKKQIRGWYENQAAEAEFTAKGHEFTAILSKKAKERKITNIRKLARFLGKVFWDVCTVGMEAIDKYTTEEQRAKFLAEGLTGSRTVKAVRNP